jgi:hypothetical protein
MPPYQLVEGRYILSVISIQHLVYALALDHAFVPASYLEGRAENLGSNKLCHDGSAF